MTKRSVFYCIILAMLFSVLGAGMILFWEARCLYKHAPEGPGLAKGLPGRYYNLVYNLTPCSSMPLERYDKDGISFFYFSLQAAPHMRLFNLFSASPLSPAVSILHYEQPEAYMAGNVVVDKYSPKGKIASESELKLFVMKYAEGAVGANPEITYGVVPGASFSALAKSGSREGLCLTDSRGTLYCLTDEEMAMQNGSVPVWPYLRYTLGFGSVSGNSTETSGLKYWLERPAWEKRAECNFAEIKRTINVHKGK